MLVLSVFPGIGLLDQAFEQEGFCVVRGPDVLWGGDIRHFHPPPGVFAGVIGGPPCQYFSVLRYANPFAGRREGNLIPEFERVVSEAQPTWFLMENVPPAPEPLVPGYQVFSLLLNNRWVGEVQNRLRRFSFGTAEGRPLLVEVAVFESPYCESAVLAGHGDDPSYRRSHGGGSRTVEEMARLQGLPEDFLADTPFTQQGKRRVLGNGVPLPMGRAIAQAIKRAL